MLAAKQGHFCLWKTWRNSLCKPVTAAGWEADNTPLQGATTLVPVACWGGNLDSAPYVGSCSLSRATQTYLLNEWTRWHSQIWMRTGGAKQQGDRPSPGGISWGMQPLCVLTCYRESGPHRNPEVNYQGLTSHWRCEVNPCSEPPALPANYIHAGAAATPAGSSKESPAPQEEWGGSWEAVQGLCPGLEKADRSRLEGQEGFKAACGGDGQVRENECCIFS